MYRAKLKGIVKGLNESIPELSQSIKKLTRRAYPTADLAVIDTPALDYFIDALTDSDMRLRLREMRPKNIDEAEVLAIRFETYKLADAQRTHTVNNLKVSQNHDIVGAIKQAIGSDLQALTKEIQNLVRSSQNQRPKFHKTQENSNWENRNMENKSHYYPKRDNNFRKPRQNDFHPKNPTNYNKSGSGVGSRQNHGVDPKQHH